MRKILAVLLLMGAVVHTAGILMPTVAAATTVRGVIDTEALATKSEYMACRSAIVRSCFAPSKCEDSSYQNSPCVRVSCGSLPVGKDKDGNDISAFLGGYSGGGPAGWDIKTVLSADDYAGFRSDTWEEAMSDKNRINICRQRYEAQAFIDRYGNAAEKAATTTVKTAAAPTTRGNNLSPQQIASCSEEIKRKQFDSQKWPGDVNHVAARLGQFQKDLFEGRCAGHPEAQAYIAGANKMLGYGGNAMGGGSSASVGHQGNIELQSAPQCAKYYVVSETPETRTSLKKFSFGIRNTCNFPVYIAWNGYFNDVETQSINYSILLKRGTSSRPIFGPGDKIEANPFSIATQKRFHAKIHSVCPTEAEATRLTGKQIALVSQGPRGVCIAKIIDRPGVRAAQ